MLPLFSLVILFNFSVYVYRHKKNDPAAKFLILFFLSIGLSYLGGYASGRLDDLSRLLFAVILVLVPIFFIHFVQVYYLRYGTSFVPRWMLPFLYSVTAIVTLVEAGSIWFDLPPYPLDKQLNILFFAVCNIIIVFQLIRKFLQHRKDELHSLWKIKLITHAVAFMPILLLSILPQLFGVKMLLPSEITAIFLLAIPISYLYLFTTKKLFDVDFVIHQFYYNSVIAFPSALMLTGLVYLVIGSNENIITGIQMLIVLYAAILCLLTGKEKLDLILKPRMIKDISKFQESLERFVEQIPRVMKRTDLDRLFQQEVRSVLAVDTASIYELNTEFSDTISEEDRERISEIQTAFKQMNLESYIGEQIPLPSGLCMILSIQEKTTSVLWLSNKWDKTSFHHLELLWLKSIANFYHLTCENISLVELMVEEIQPKSYDQQQNVPPWLDRLLFHLTEKERQKLAADLHDEVLQIAIGVQTELESFLMTYPAEARLTERTENIQSGMRLITNSIRQTCNELYPPHLMHLDLNESLQALIRVFTSHSGCKVHFYSSLMKNECHNEMKLTIYRIVQELLTNAIKHAQAKVVHIELDQLGQILHLKYRDNGVGMDETGKNGIKSMGIAGIQRRVVSLNGQLTIMSETGKGFKVNITLPMNGEDQWREETLYGSHTFSG